MALFCNLSIEQPSYNNHSNREMEAIYIYTQNSLKPWLNRGYMRNKIILK